jgi:hypothetical protein
LPQNGQGFNSLFSIFDPFSKHTIVIETARYNRLFFNPFAHTDCHSFREVLTISATDNLNHIGGGASVNDFVNLFSADAHIIPVTIMEMGLCPHIMTCVFFELIRINIPAHSVSSLSIVPIYVSLSSHQ